MVVRSVDNKLSVFSAALLLVSSLLLTSVVQAQTVFMQLRDQTVSPAFEGWWENEDGSYKLFFGYMNSNWEQEFNIPVGPDNYFTLSEPGAQDDLSKDFYNFANADYGQPTHFYPRRNPFLFTVDVPAEFGQQDLVWTLKTRGKVHRAYATLKSDYMIDPQVISTEVGGDYGSLADSLRTNISPELRVEGETRRTVRAGQTLALAAIANDPDNLPSRRGNRAPTTLDQLYRPPSSIVAISGPGLRFSWSVYRGPAKQVSFMPAQFKTWTDTRVYSNSPWSPPFQIPEVPANNRWTTDVTFNEPGEYVLRGIASDGSMFTYENIYITVVD
jgi:hypothetical protein